MSYFNLIILSLLVSCTGGRTFTTKEKNRIAHVANSVADWQIENLNYVSEGNLHDYGIDAWTNGVFYLGLIRWMESGAGKEKYAQWLKTDIGEVNSWKIPANFIEYPKYRLYHADELCVGQFYEAYYQKYSTKIAIKDLKNRLDAIIANPPALDMSYRSKQRWTWCDALFMAPPAYFCMASITGEDIYADYAHKEFLATYNHLYDHEENLFFRDDSYRNKREANGAKIFWGRGNGWVVAGLANIIEQLPSNSEIRPFYIHLFQEMSGRLVELQQPDGFWHASLLDPVNYPNPETSATALITYAFAYGINNGMLNREQFVAPLKKAWSSLLSAVDTSGKLGWVQPIGADPKLVTKEMTAVYGAGAFLLAAKELYEMN